MDQTPSGDELRPDDEPPQPPEAAPSAPVEPVERDAWDSFVHSDEPAAGAPGEEAAPVAAPAEVASGEPASPTAWRGRRRGGGWLTSLLLVILALGLMAATAWGILQYRQRAMTQNAAQQAVALIATGAPADMAPRIADIQADLTAGHSAAAAQKIAELSSLLAQQQGVAAQPGSPLLPAPPGAAAGPLPEDAYKDLPTDAATFFRQHEDLFRRFLQMCTLARELKEKGVNVDELRRMRDAIIEAARLGRLDTVEKKMAVMMGQLQQQTGGGDGRGPLAIKAQRLKEVAQRAEAQGRDIRPALALMKRAEQAAQAGHMDEASKYIDQALAAVKRAPRITGGRGFGRRDGRPGLMLGGGGGRMNPLLPFVRVLLGVMSAEEGNLQVVSEQLVHMRELLTGESATETTPPPAPPASPQVEALKPMVERALGEMQAVAQRRQELTREMNRKRGDKLPPPGPGQGMTPEQRRGMIALVLERLGALVDRIRAMPENEYMQQKGSLLGEIMQTVLRPPPPEPAQQTPQPPAFPQDPEQRIRAKMRQASPVLKQWELQGKDTAPVEALFAEARKALYDKKLDVAEQKVDEARKLLGLEPEKPVAGGAAAPSPTPPVDPAIKLDLRAH